MAKDLTSPFSKARINRLVGACRAFIRHYWFSPSPLASLCLSFTLWQLTSISPASSLYFSPPLSFYPSLPCGTLMKCTSRHDHVLSFTIFVCTLFISISLSSHSLSLTDSSFPPRVDFPLFQPIIDARRLIDRRPRFSDLLLSRVPSRTTLFPLSTLVRNRRNRPPAIR